MTHVWRIANVCHICDRIDRKAPEKFFVQEIKCSFSFSASLEAVFAAARSRRCIIKPIINAIKLPILVYPSFSSASWNSYKRPYDRINHFLIHQRPKDIPAIVKPKPMAQ